MQKQAFVEIVGFRPEVCLGRDFFSKVKLFFPTIILFLMGCAFNSYQSPNVLPPRKVAVGYGLGQGRGDISFKEVAIYLRAGIIKNCEGGIRLWGGGIFSDIKIQMLKKPILLAVDFGASYCPPWDIGIVGADVVQWLGFYPTIMLGTEHFYGGIKYIYINELRDYMYGDLQLPGIMLGASFGSQVQLKPEVNFFYNILSDSPLTVTVGVGVQTNL